MNKTKQLDQFYTNPILANKLVSKFLKMGFLPETDVLFVEPSAGQGAFVDALCSNNKLVYAVDIDPKRDYIIEQDFLSNKFYNNLSHKQVIIIGNPPFGFASSTAVKFFNKAAEIAKIIAFIVPKTFRKHSIQNKLDLSFHLQYEEDLPKNSFIKDNISHDVPCIFQVWLKKDIFREKTIAPDISHLLEFTTPDKADFSLRRVGGRTGSVLPGVNYTPNTTYFIKSIKKDIQFYLEKIDWNDIKNSTVGVRSISKSEIAIKLMEIINNEKN